MYRRRFRKTFGWRLCICFSVRGLRRFIYNLLVFDGTDILSLHEACSFSFFPSRRRRLSRRIFLVASSVLVDNAIFVSFASVFFFVSGHRFGVLLYVVTSARRPYGCVLDRFRKKDTYRSRGGISGGFRDIFADRNPQDPKPPEIRKFICIWLYILY